MALPYGSPHSTSCVHGPHDVDPPAADAVHFVVQIGDDAGVIRDDTDAFADVWRALGEAQINVPVFLTQGGEDGVRILDNHTMAGDPLSQIRCKGLGSCVEDGPVWGGATDDRGHDAHRTLAERGRPGRDSVAVVVDVRAGPVLREAWDLVHLPHPGGPTAADHVHRDSPGFQEMNRLTHERA